MNVADTIGAELTLLMSPVLRVVQARPELADDEEPAETELVDARILALDRLLLALGWNPTARAAGKLPGDALVKQLAKLPGAIEGVVSGFVGMNSVTDLGAWKKVVKGTISVVKTALAIKDLVTPDKSDEDKQKERILLGRLAEDLAHHLLAVYLDVWRPLAYDVLVLLGVILTPQDGVWDSDSVIVIKNDDGSERTLVIRSGQPRVRFNFARIEALFDKPERLLSYYLRSPPGSDETWSVAPNTLTWPNNDATALLLALRLFPRLARLLHTIGLPARFDIVEFELDGDLATPPIRVGSLLAPIYQFDTEDEEEEEESEAAATEDESSVEDAEANAEIGLALSLLKVSEDQGKLRGGFLLQPYGALNFEVPLGDGWEVFAETEGSLPGLFVNGDQVYIDGATGDLRLALGLRRDAPLFLGPEQGSHVRVGALSARGFVDLSTSGGQDYGAGFALTDGQVKVAVDEADSFVRSLLPPDGVLGTFALQLDWSKRGGLHVRGAAGFDLVIPLNLDLGLVEVHQLHLHLGVGVPLLALDARLDVTGKFGIADLTVTGLGVAFGLDVPDGKFADADVSARFLPPTGIGLGINAPGVRGGGFLRIEPELARYSGAFGLVLADRFEVNAVALIETRMPDGGKGFSFAGLLFGSFDPGFELGLGFNLKGIGGFFGFHRTMDMAVLEAMFIEGRSRQLLFPNDVIKNAPAILADLSRAFPIQEDHFVFGPAIELAWGYPAIYTLELGVFIEVPGPFKMVLLGELTCLIPPVGVPLVELHVDVMGQLDTGQKFFWLRGRLRDSRILTVELWGDMALSVSWGDDAHVVFSIGGFHPSFQPPARLAAMKRLGSGIRAKAGPVKVEITREMYFAITSNTLQMGSSEQLRVEVKGVGGLSGSYGFDAIVIFSPFSFEVTFHADCRVWVAGFTIANLGVDGLIAGPNPWRIAGSVSISILWWDVGFDFDVTFGEKQAEEELVEHSPVNALVGCLRDPACWRAAGPAQGSAVLLASDLDGALVLPDTPLAFHQNKVPLGVSIERFAERTLDEAVTLKIGRTSIGGAEINEDDRTSRMDRFAPGSFQSLDDDKKLQSKGYIEYDAGFLMRPDNLVLGASVPSDRKFDQKIIDRSPSGPHTVQPITVTGLTIPLLASSRGPVRPIPGVRLGTQRPTKKKVA